MATGYKVTSKSPRPKRGRTENEIERYRIEGNWNKVIELVPQITDKTSVSSKQRATMSKLGHDWQPGSEVALSALVLGESKLEKWDISIGQNPNRPRKELDECETHLKLAANSKDDRIRLEANLLLAKLYYVRGEYGKASDLIVPAQLDRITFDSVISRIFKLVTEAFAIKGLCLEQLQPDLIHQTSRNPIIDNLEKAGDLCLIHLQALDASGRPGSTSGGSTVPSTPGPGSVGTPVLIHQTPSTAPLPSTNGISPGNISSSRVLDASISRIVEMAVNRSPIIHMLRGAVPRAVARFRQLVRVVETPYNRFLRQKLTRQLAEVLLRGVCVGTYQKFSTADGDKSLSNGATPSPNISVPQAVASVRRYDLSAGDRFVPEDHVQEAILLLLISEFMASQEAILNRGAELKDARTDTLNSTAAVYDLLAIALARKGAYEFLYMTLEHALKFSYNEFHIWFQFALSLINAKKYYRALLVLKECLRIDPKHHLAHMLAARLCFHHLHLVKEGIEYAERAALHSPASSTHLRSRAHLTLGWGYGLRARECKLLDGKKRDEMLALKQFQEAVKLDPKDFQAWYMLALQLSQMRRVGEGRTACHHALALHHTHLHSLHLCVLLHTTQRSSYPEAERLLQLALTHHPNNISLLLTQARLAAALHGPASALRVYRRMVEVWRDHYYPDYDTATGFLEKLRNQVAQFDELCCTASLDRETTAGSLRAESMVASKIEHTLSDIASSAGRDPDSRLNINESSYVRIQILLHLAELYLEMNRLQETKSCIDDAAMISRLNHQVLHMKGRLHEVRREFREARKAYETAVAINPAHVKSQQRLGRLLHLLGEGQLSEKVLRDALSNDPTASRTWQLLGEVLNSMGQEDTASQCLSVAADLECSEPIESFHLLPRYVH